MNTPADKPDLPGGTPDRIYLCLGLPDGPEETATFANLHEVTWCDDQIEDGDPEYIRADVVQRLLADERRKALEEIRRPVLDAINLLTLDADALRECSTHFDGRDYDWTGEPDAKANYDRMLRVVDTLRLLIDRKEPTT